MLQCARILLVLILPDPSMLLRLRTYLLGDGDVLSRVVLAGLLRVVRYRPLALGELLGRGFGVRHFELLVSLVSPGELTQVESSNIESARPHEARAPSLNVSPLRDASMIGARKSSVVEVI